MPAYNSEQFIGEAIGSVVQQTFTCWELLIIDDGSTDRTSEIAKSFAAQDDRIKYIKLENNCGASTAGIPRWTSPEGNTLHFSTATIPGFLKNLPFRSVSWRKTMCFSAAPATGKLTNTAQTWAGGYREKNLDYEGVLKRCPGNLNSYLQYQNPRKVFHPRHTEAKRLCPVASGDQEGRTTLWNPAAPRVLSGKMQFPVGQKNSPCGVSVESVPINRKTALRQILPASALPDRAQTLSHLGDFFRRIWPETALEGRRTH